MEQCNYLTDSQVRRELLASSSYMVRLAKYSEGEAFMAACKQERADAYYLMMEARNFWAVAFSRALSWLLWSDA